MFKQQPQPDAASLAAAASAALDRFFVRAADVDVEELLRTRLEATSLPPPGSLRFGLGLGLGRGRGLG